MAKRRNFCIGNYFHAYSRGVNKDEIFLEHRDYLKFMELIESRNCKETQREIKKSNKVTILVKIYCYTIMPNHFHFELKELISGGISKFIQKVLKDYTQYFNKKYERSGALFESRFKDKLIDSDQYFKHLTRYIWNNPIKLINHKYKSIDLYYDKIKLTNKEKDFALNYPYKKFPSNYSPSP